MAPGFYDVLLGAVITLQATALAYLHQPRWKALILTLPFPFTIASLAVGRPIDATNVLGLVLLLVFTNAVRLMHHSLKLPIFAAITAGILLYCGLGIWLAPLVPSTSPMFWASTVFVLLLAAGVLRLMPPRDEPGHRTPLPLWIKLPLIAAVVLGIVLLKHRLQGFLTFFPMVGVFAAYEARHSLWTMSRQIAVIMLTMPSLITACFLAQNFWGLEVGLAIGWVAFGATLWLWQCWENATRTRSTVQREDLLKN